ncbi:CDP-alcohol phosphatidyltransferase [Pyrolobus fumarii 1A]|uniref:CDP-alcohol phosphatidyltransferase n=1 Tax=Pyrolobus fumarii (strain DSM 11204 / 1A) TaxID=694429 RepID=G0EE03_PYRF1|nr:CDP-alcohol phosphatidyltransferase family protein [Pyrolobus fumarii]AEM37919.1 CDP-alcohol phosphatidyltransferase [Pyrolobus fumarii 1A]
MSQAAKVAKPTDGPVSRLINRRVSWRVTRILVKLGVSNPNAVTIATGVFGVLAALPYLAVDPVMAAIAGLLVQLASILDGVDGEIARLLNRKSRFGAYLDAVTDRIVDIVSFGLATYAVVEALGIPRGVATLLATLIVSGDIMVSYVHARGEASIGTSIQLLGKIRPWASRDVRLFLLAVGSVAVPPMGWHALLAVLIFTSIASYAYVVAKTVELWLLWRRGEIG